MQVNDSGLTKPFETDRPQKSINQHIGNTVQNKLAYFLLFVNYFSLNMQEYIQNTWQDDS